MSEAALSLPPEEAPDDAIDIFVARQPIFDLQDQVVGYELLYRGDAITGMAQGVDSAAMSNTVIVNAFMGIGIRELTDGHRGWINFTREQLLSEVWRLFDRDLVVIELLESIARDPETIAACRALHDAGYKFALDDFVYTDGDVPLLELSPVVKVDVLGRDPQEMAQILDKLSRHRVTLLAERVETQAVRDECRSFGFKLFQGYFYSRPETITKREPSVAHLTIIRLLNLLHDPNISDGKVEEAISGDVTLCYKLLRMVNSAAMGGRGIDSIGQAVRLLGRKTLHRWLSLLLVSTLVAEGGSRLELAHTAMRRARFCETLMCAATGSREHGPAFMVGLFSLIDAVLRMPMDLCLESIDISADVRAALLDRMGPYVTPLTLVEAYEMAMWDTVHSLARELNVRTEMLPRLYMEAVRWTKERLAV